jgi:hypothetical protein
MKGFFNHHGIVVRTAEGNVYLIHSTPSDGVVVTEAKHMSDKWIKKHDITVGADLTVQQVRWGGHLIPRHYVVNKHHGLALAGAARRERVHEQPSGELRHEWILHRSGVRHGAPSPGPAARGRRPRDLP